MPLFNDMSRAVRKIKNGVVSFVKGSPLVDNDTLWKFANELWEEAENKIKEVNEAEQYYEGRLNQPLPALSLFKDQTHSNDNIIQPICETIVANLLDAQFEIAVLPEINSMNDMNGIKDCQAIADIFNDEIKNVEKQGHQGDITDELVAKDGEKCGMGKSQVEWSTQNRADGEIVISHIPAKDVRWIDNVLECFQKEYSVQEAKELFGKNEDGVFDIDKCAVIDEISEVKIGDKDRKYTGAVVSYTDSVNNTAGQAFASKGNVGGIQAGRTVKVVTLYLLDDSCYAPDEDDNAEESRMKEVFNRMYPNGRVICFNPGSNTDKVILKDEPLPETFKSLGNIDTYNPVLTNSKGGESPLKILYPIQDRIDGLYNKYRLKVQYDIDTQLIDPTFGIDGGALVNGPVTMVEGFNERKGQMSELMTNDGIAKGAQILEAIEKLKASAYEKAGINQTMLSGYRQTGTNSAEQVEALNESPLVKIRRRQQNFVNYKIARAEKILMFIMQNYTDQRFIALSSAMNGAKMARIQTDPKTQQKSLQLLQEVEGIVKVIKSYAFNDGWRLKVECTAGTGVPRSRKEASTLTDKIATSPIIASGDLDMIELYLNAQDYPYKRGLLALLRDKQQKAQEPSAKVSAAQGSLLKNPQMGQAFADIFKSLTGYPAAQGQILRMFGLDGTAGTIVSLPANEVTSKTSALDIAAVAPAQISSNPEQAIFGNKVAEDLKNAEHNTNPKMEVLQ